MMNRGSRGSPTIYFSNFSWSHPFHEHEYFSPLPLNQGSYLVVRSGPEAIGNLVSPLPNGHEFGIRLSNYRVTLEVEIST